MDDILFVKAQQQNNIVEYTISRKRKVLFQKQFVVNTTENINLDVFNFFGLVRAIKYLTDNKLEIAIGNSNPKAIFWCITKKVDIELDVEFKTFVGVGLDYLKTIKIPILLKV